MIQCDQATKTSMQLALELVTQLNTIQGITIIHMCMCVCEHIVKLAS